MTEQLLIIAMMFGTLIPTMIMLWFALALVMFPLNAEKRRLDPRWHRFINDTLPWKWRDGP